MAHILGYLHARLAMLIESSKARVDIARNDVERPWLAIKQARAEGRAPLQVDRAANLGLAHLAD